MLIFDGFGSLWGTILAPVCALFRVQNAYDFGAWFEHRFVMLFRSEKEPNPPRVNSDQHCFAIYLPIHLISSS